MPANCAVVSTWQSEEPTTHLQEIQDTRYAYPVSTLTDCSSSCVRQSTTASLMPSSYIPDTRLETWRRYEIGFFTVAQLIACVWPDSNESCTCGRCSALSDELFSGSQCHLICITQDIRYHRTGQPIKPVSMETWKLILTVLPICSVQRQKHACCLLFFLWCQHGNQRNSSTTQQH